MVMQQDNVQEEPVQQDFLVDVTPPEEVDTAVADELDADPATETLEEVVETTDAPVVDGVVPPPEVPAEAQPEKTAEQIREERQRLADLDELGRRRREQEEAERKQQLLQRARRHEQTLLDDYGLMPDQARKLTQQMIGYENKLHDTQRKSMELLQFAEGRNIAALQIGMKHGLIPKAIVDDINVLLRSQSPDSMDFEAARMAELRKTRAEIEQLKQGQVKPQAFDNSQGAAEAVSSDDRLIDAYLNGDRSEAAVQAAKRLTFGS